VGGYSRYSRPLDPGLEARPLDPDNPDIAASKIAAKAIPPPWEGVPGTYPGVPPGARPAVYPKAASAALCRPPEPTRYWAPRTAAAAAAPGSMPPRPGLGTSGPGPRDVWRRLPLRTSGCVNGKPGSSGFFGVRGYRSSCLENGATLRRERAGCERRKYGWRKQPALT